MRKSVIVRILFLFLYLLNAQASKVAFPDMDEWRTIKVGAKMCSVVYIPALGKKKGALIIIQGKEQRRFEYQILNYLRHQLPEYGWSTLGINIPRVNAKSTFLAPEMQLSQSLSLLKEAGHKAVFVLLYGEGAGNLLAHFINEKRRDFSGILLLSAYAEKRSHYDTLVKLIKTWRTFVFDIRAQFDLSFVEADFKLRRKIFDETPKFYRQVILAGAQHNYWDTKNALTKWVWGWMRRYSKKAPVLNER